MEAQVEIQLMDELEAGEAAIDLDDKEPQESFARFCVRTPDNDLISLAQGPRDAAGAAV